MSAVPKAKSNRSVNTRIMRVHQDTYGTIARLRDEYAKINGLHKCSYSTFLDECCRVGEALLHSQELYLVDGQLYSDIAEARGASILKSVKTGRRAVPPTILVKLGNDKELK